MRVAFGSLDKTYDFSKDLGVSDVLSLYTFVRKRGDLSLALKFSASRGDVDCMIFWMKTVTSFS